MTNKAIKRASSHLEEQPELKHQANLAPMKPVHYFFFCTKEAAVSFNPEHIKGEHWVYVTPYPLQFLFNQINLELGKNQTARNSHSLHTQHYEVNGYSSTHHQPTPEHPEHLSFCIKDPARMDRMIAHLKRKSIKLTLMS